MLQLHLKLLPCITAGTARQMVPHAVNTFFFPFLSPCVSLALSSCEGRLINLPLSMCKINEMICHTTHCHKANPIRNVLINSRARWGQESKRKRERGRKTERFFGGQSSVEKTLKYIDFVALLSAFGMCKKHAQARAGKGPGHPPSPCLLSPLSLACP